MMDCQEQDRQERVGRSLLHHGRGSDRIYLMEYHRADRDRLWQRIQELQEQQNYGKHFFLLPQGEAPFFLARGYRLEAMIPGYFQGEEAAIILVRYFSPSREILSREDRELLEACAAWSIGEQPGAPQGSEPSRRGAPGTAWQVRRALPGDIPALAGLYERTFASYPFPIGSPEYLAKTMGSDVDYYLIPAPEGFAHPIAAAASAEKHPVPKSVEMTDFAVDPAFRGAGLAGILLSAMEEALLRQEYRCFYTIARLSQPAMNRTFFRARYRYGGTLIRNTQIGGDLESMNVWYKPAGKPPPGSL
ncbi:beta-lysine acetyltransferase [Alkalispirochaeta americana]|uniref:Beta-lysine acetyltransferase n=1 Tax=Alkalispirochaeta americana TaxID=159291 RepID=A0A1N6TF64_9SPIO|nr:putative beta-lysine N-acetyltransferase [Alkalispirochaeta americana]SIQ51897.1 beta-lysine acetyltransferase [Alkalispirochaeta americana]